MPKIKAATVAEYISKAPKEAQKHLRDLRAMLKEVVPKAKEGMKWNTPMFEESRILFAYGAYKTHLNFMPTPAAIDAFASELRDYTIGKGSIQLPYDKPLPKALIQKIAAFRAHDLREHDARWM